MSAYGFGRSGGDPHAGAAVIHDRVGCLKKHATNHVARSIVKINAVQGVPQVGGAGGIGPDEVSLNDVSRRLVEQEAMSGVAGNDVARSSICAANQIVGRIIFDLN